MNFEERIHLIKSKYESIHSTLFGIIDQQDLGYTLSLIHYSLCFILIYGVVFGCGFPFYFSSILLFITYICNINDSGCIVLKLERIYLGKNWYGPYGILNWVSPITPQYITFIYNIISFILSSIMIYKILTRTC